MPQPATQPTFVPLTVAAARAAAASPAPPPARASASVLLPLAERVDDTAADCWAALLGGCDSIGRHILRSRLIALTEATAVYAGRAWWLADGSTHRRRVASATERVAQAVRDEDGARFAEAFVAYDQAVALTVVTVQERLRTGAP